MTILSNVREARLAIWQGMPSEVEGLAHRRGLMQPAGALLYAEADTRVLAEQLHSFLDALDRGEVNENLVRSALACILGPFADHLDGLYGLPQAASLVRAAHSSLDSTGPKELLSMLGELALYVSRLNLWLDLLIPWNDMNELMRSPPT